VRKSDRIPRIDEIAYISENVNPSGVNNTLEVKLRVFKGEKMLCASNEELGIFTQGKSWNSLMKNIRDVIECYFNIPSADAVRIKLDIDPAVTDNAETACC
jgi:predicted RNase H-like HicB family nuclease